MSGKQLVSCRACSYTTIDDPDTNDGISLVGHACTFNGCDTPLVPSRSLYPPDKVAALWRALVGDSLPVKEQDA